MKWKRNKKKEMSYTVHIRTHSSLSNLAYSQLMHKPADFFIQAVLLYVLITAENLYEGSVTSAGRIHTTILVPGWLYHGVGPKSLTCSGVMSLGLND